MDKPSSNFHGFCVCVCVRVCEWTWWSKICTYNMGLYTQKQGGFKFFLFIAFKHLVYAQPLPCSIAFIISKQQNLRDIRVTRPSQSAQTQKEVPLESTTIFTKKLAKFCSKVKFKIQKWNDLEVCNGHKWGGKLSKNSLDFYIWFWV